MNAKTTQKYNLIISIANTDAKDAKIPLQLADLCANDFQTAFEMWEFTLGKYQDALKDPAVCESLEAKPFALFQRVSETKMRQLLCESLPLIKLIYGCCVTACTGNNLSFLVNQILAAKIDVADECLAKLKSNPHINFNEVMRTVVDSVFSTYCARNSVKVPVLNKKQKTLLLGYVDKIKGTNKALLTQRLKEL